MIIRSLKLIICLLIVSLCFIIVSSNIHSQQISKDESIASSEDNTVLTIDTFVRQLHIHGVPYDKASKFTSEDLPKLYEILSSQEDQEYWSNAIITVCIIGDEKSLPIINEFITSKRGNNISEDDYTAISSAIISLGYFINNTNSKDAINILTNYSNPNYWDQADWISPYHENDEERNMQLSSYAVLGMGLSGNPDLLHSLQKMKIPTNDKLQKQFQAQYTELIEEAIIHNEKISKIGLEEYYKSNIQ